MLACVGSTSERNVVTTGMLEYKRTKISTFLLRMHDQSGCLQETQAACDDSACPPTKARLVHHCHRLCSRRCLKRMTQGGARVSHKH